MCAKLLRFGVILLVAGLFSIIVSAQDALPKTTEISDDVEFTTAYLALSLDEKGQAQITFQASTLAPFSPAQISALEQALQTKLSITNPVNEQLLTPPQNTVHNYLARGNTAFACEQQQVRGQLNLAPFCNALRDSAIKHLHVTIAHPIAANESSAQFGAEENNFLGNVDLKTYEIELAAPSFQSISIAYGNAPKSFLQKFGILIITLCLPVLLAAFLAGSLLWKHQRNPQKSTLASLGGLNLLVHLLPVLWWVALYYAKTADYVAAWLQSPSPWISHPTRIALYVLPPIFAGLICNAIYQYAVTIIKGENKPLSEILAQAALSICVTFLPMILLYNGLFAFVRGEARQGVFFFITYVLLQTFTEKWRWRAMGFKPYIIPNGILRHRLFELANRCDVQLQQVFLISDQHGNAANAFAASGNNIMFTESLLENFSRREIDFIASHELAHLQLNHATKKALFTLITFPIIFVCALIFGIGLGLLSMLLPSVFSVLVTHAYPVILLLAIGLSTLVELYISRRFECAADAGAVTMIADPEAAITALVRLGKLNLEPMQWGKFNSKFLTHPSVLQRVNRIARQNAIAPERVKQLIAQPPYDPARYTINEGRALPSVTALTNTAQTKIELPVAKQKTLVLAPILFGIFGVCLGWLLIAPGYFPRQFFDAYSIPTYLLPLGCGLLFAAWQGLSMRSRLLKMLTDRIDFAPMSTLHSPTITTACEMDELLLFTNELLALGFNFAGDYQFTTEPQSRATGFIRIFTHPKFHCYAEVTQVVNVLNRPRPVCCTIISDYGEGWSFATSNKEFDGLFYALRSEKNLWQSRPLATASYLLESHLEQREILAKKFGQQLVSELSAAQFIAATNATTGARKNNLRQKNFIKFMVEADFCRAESKKEWLGKTAKSAAKNPSSKTELATQAKA